LFFRNLTEKIYFNNKMLGSPFVTGRAIKKSDNSIHSS